MTCILIAYASHYGQTRLIAEQISFELEKRGHHVLLHDLRTRRPVKFEGLDGIVLGSRVEMERHAKELVDFINDHRTHLDRLPTAVFSVSMSAAAPDAGPDPKGYLSKLFTEVRWMPRLQRAFAGGLPYLRYGWFTRWMMKMISRRTHGPTDTSRNHELTDWNAVQDFAREIDATWFRAPRSVTMPQPM